MSNAMKGILTRYFGGLAILCCGQASYAVTPHNVIYWNNDTTTLQTLAASAYTDVIVNFVVPDSSCNLGSNGGLGSSMAASVQTLHQKGKTVLVAFGGSNATSTAYQVCNGNISNLVGQLQTIVNSNGFDGVDIDFEDDNGFNGAYDGVNFLTQLTNNLYKVLPQGHNIITHAPQTGYWTEKFKGYPNPPYAMIFQNTQGSVAWFNNQSYNNCLTGHTDCTAQQKFANYRAIVGLGVPPTKLLMGLPVAYCATTGKKKQCNGDGYIPLVNGTPNDVQILISELQGAYPNQFGGVMGWNYADDLAYDSGTWGANIAHLLTITQHTPRANQTPAGLSQLTK